MPILAKARKPDSGPKGSETRRRKDQAAEDGGGNYAKFIHSCGQPAIYVSKDGKWLVTEHPDGRVDRKPYAPIGSLPPADDELAEGAENNTGFAERHPDLKA